ncbi:MAG: hypothetical protein KGL48_11650 [Sphingomonadales bacterium]|nr:hypothetical protein [Sphingomonadales bacterium]MDE2569811.1 hypothetical protein [Sphingomonadales bacterium]
MLRRPRLRAFLAHPSTPIRTNPEIVKLRAVEKWNGQLPTYTGNGPMPFLDIGK